MKSQPTGATSHVIFSAQVVDAFTDDDSKDDEIESIPEPVIKDQKDDEELDKQLQELLNDSREAEENKEYITAAEFDEILEMNIDEFEQWMDKPPLCQPSKNQEENSQMISTDTPTDLDIQKLQGESLLSFVILPLLSVQIQIISNIIVLSKTIQAYTEFVNEKRKLEEALATFLTEKHSVFEEKVFLKIDFKSTDFSNNHFLCQNRKFKGLVYYLFCSPVCNFILNHFWFKHFVNNRKHHCCPRLNSSVGEESLDPDE